MEACDARVRLSSHASTSLLRRLSAKERVRVAICAGGRWAAGRLVGACRNLGCSEDVASRFGHLPVRWARNAAAMG